MLKISVVEARNQSRLVLEGKLLAPWVTELRTAYEKARSNLQNRELIIDLKNVTAIRPEGENVLLELMNERVKFRCGVFTKHVLIQLTRSPLSAVTFRRLQISPFQKINCGRATLPWT